MSSNDSYDNDELVAQYRRIEIDLNLCVELAEKIEEVLVEIDNSIVGDQFKFVITTATKANNLMRSLRRLRRTALENRLEITGTRGNPNANGPDNDEDVKEEAKETKIDDDSDTEDMGTFANGDVFGDDVD